MVLGIPSLEAVRVVVGQDPNKSVLADDNPRAVDTKAEFAAEREDAARPAIEPLLHLALLDRVDPELRNRRHGLLPYGRSLAAGCGFRSVARQGRTRAPQLMQNVAAAGKAAPQDGQLPPTTADGGAGGGGFDGAYAGPGHAHADGAGTAR